MASLSKPLVRSSLEDRNSKIEHHLLSNQLALVTISTLHWKNGCSGSSNNLKQDDEKRVLFIPVKWTDYEIARESENLNRSFSGKVERGYS